jgi:hypothetical protein
VITSLELIENAARPELFKEIVKGWEEPKYKSILEELMQALGARGLQPEG